MSRIISVFGPPKSGKTTFAVSLAREIYRTYSCHVCLFSADNEVPLLPVLFPSRKENELFSAGNALSKPVITKEDALRSLTTVKNTSGLCVAGFTRGENRYTYPEFTMKSAENYLEALGEVTDVIIADCTPYADSVITRAALKHSSRVFFLMTPELQSVSWYSSQMPLFPDDAFPKEDWMKILNIPFKDVFLPAEEVKAATGKPAFTLPCSKEAKRNLARGEMFSASPGKEYSGVIKKITERAV